MKYALGNMLNGAGGLNADQLALDLQFAADKTLTARKGPTPVFTRASSGTFVGSNGLIQSAGNNVARFDHDPVTLASRGLLIEESRTNASWYSGALVIGTGWGGNGVTSATSSTGPDGNSSYIVSEDSSNGQHFLSSSGGGTSSNATSVTSGVTYTASIFIKKVTGSVDWIQLTCGSAGFGSAQYANFNIGNGTTGNSNGLASGTSPRIENYGNGWYRCSISVTATATTSATSNLVIGFIQNTNGTTRLPSYAGSTSNSVLAAMCQFEAGSFATSYIPTTTGTAVRSADLCSISGAAFSGMWNASEGTMFVSGMRYHGVSGINSRIWSLHQSGAAATGINTVRTASGELLGSTSGSGDILNMGSSYAAFQSFKQACRIKQGDYAGSQNGLTTVTSSNNYAYLANTLSIGYYLNGGGYHNGCLSAIRFYKKGLPNAKLQALTV